MSESELFFKPIEESIHSLAPEDQILFQQLAVFLEDVNIKPKVLATLWGLDKIEAETIMMKFVHKSLAVRKWNELQKSYVYGVHDLIGDFLKRNVTPEKEKELHTNLIRAYREACGGNWAKLPGDDNYIFYYIGYHLKKASMNDLFAFLYFDLEFLEAKLRVTGPADLLRDFNKYKNLISNGENEGLEKIAEYTNFIENFGAWIYQGVDVIQAALETQPGSSVHNFAEKLILEKHTSQRYLHCATPEVEKPVPLILPIKDDISAVCFGKTVTEAIIARGYGNPDLELYNFKTKSVTRRFSGHSGRINCLNLSASKLLFLSASMDTTIRIWSLDSSETSSGERTPSPRERQESYINLFNSDYSGVKPLESLEHSSSVSVGVFGKTTDRIITSLCIDGSVVMWRDYSKLWEQNQYAFKSIDLWSSDEIVVAVDSFKIYFLFSHSGAVMKSVEHQCCDALSITAVSGGQGEGLALLSKKRLTFYSDTVSPSYPMDLRAQAPFSKLSSAGAHIAVTTEDGSLYVLHSENGKQLTYLQSQNSVVSFSVAEKAILAGYSDGNVFQYPLENLMSLTCLKWSAKSAQPVIAKMDSILRNIQVLIGDRLIHDLVIDDIEKMDVSVDGFQLVTVNKLGRVLFHNSESDSKLILEKPYIPSGVFLLGTAEEEQVVVLSYKRSCSSANQTLVWRQNKGHLIELKTASAVEFACLLDDGTRNLLITSPPFTVWALEGELLGSSELSGMVRISPQQRLIAVSTVSGLELYQFKTHDEQIRWKKTIEATRHIDLLEFSSSGNKLALIETDGNIKVYDCDRDSWEFMPSNSILTKPVYLAVSNSGAVCFGGNGLVCISMPDGQSTTAVLDVTSIVADPNGADIFAVTDKTGHLCKIYQDYYHCPEVSER